MSIINEIKKESEEIKEELIQIRRAIHSFPEPAFEEIKTGNLIKDYLGKLDIDISSAARTGVVGLLRGGREGKTLMLRADMDCLEIEELTDLEYKSQRKGYMHACGHDAHVTWTLGAAKILSQHRASLKGNVKFIFQPAEEIAEGGAKDMVDDGVLENPPVDMVIGAHVEVTPSYRTGVVGFRSGELNAGADFFKIRVIGKSGHGAVPQCCMDPISTSVQIYNSIQHMLTKKINPIETVLLHIGSIHGGSVNNAVPEEVVMDGTIRYFNAEFKTLLPKLLKDVISGICHANGAKYELSFTNANPPLINDAEATSFVRKLAEEYYGSQNIISIQKPDLFSEDHAFYQERVKGTYFNVGSYNERIGAVEPLHSQYFKIDEECLHLTAGFLAFCALNYLNIS